MKKQILSLLFLVSALAVNSQPAHNNGLVPYLVEIKHYSEHYYTYHYNRLAAAIKVSSDEHKKKLLDTVEMFNQKYHRVKVSSEKLILNFQTFQILKMNAGLFKRVNRHFRRSGTGAVTRGREAILFSQLKELENNYQNLVGPRDKSTSDIVNTTGYSGLDIAVFLFDIYKYIADTSAKKAEKLNLLLAQLILEPPNNLIPKSN